MRKDRAAKTPRTKRKIPAPGKPGKAYAGRDRQPQGEGIGQVGGGGTRRPTVPLSADAPELDPQLLQPAPRLGASQGADGGGWGVRGGRNELAWAPSRPGDSPAAPATARRAFDGWNYGARFESRRLAGIAYADADYAGWGRYA